MVEQIQIPERTELQGIKELYKPTKKELNTYMRHGLTILGRMKNFPKMDFKIDLTEIVELAQPKLILPKRVSTEIPLVYIASDRVKGNNLPSKRRPILIDPKRILLGLDVEIYSDHRPDCERIRLRLIYQQQE